MSKRPKRRSIFKPADPTKRLPPWLQNGTKENLIWQFKMLVLWMLVTGAYDRYNERRLDKELEARRNSNTEDYIVK